MLDERELGGCIRQSLILSPDKRPFVQMRPRARTQRIQFEITLTSDDTEEFPEGIVKGNLRLRKPEKAPAKPASAHTRQTKRGQETTKTRAAPKNGNRTQAGGGKPTGIIKSPPAKTAAAKRARTLAKAAGQSPWGRRTG